MAGATKTCQNGRERENRQAFLQRAVSDGLSERLMHAAKPSGCCTTITSIAPLKVAGFIEFHVLETAPDIERTYCILSCDGVRDGEQSASNHGEIEAGQHDRNGNKTGPIARTRKHNKRALVSSEGDDAHMVIAGRYLVTCSRLRCCPLSRAR